MHNRTTPVVDNCISEEHPCEVDFSQRFRQFSSTGNTEYQIKYWVVSDKTNNNRSTGREIGFHNRVFQISADVSSAYSIYCSDRLPVKFTVNSQARDYQSLRVYKYDDGAISIPGSKVMEEIDVEYVDDDLTYLKNLPADQSEFEIWVQLQKDGVEFYGLAKQVQISNVNFQETTDEIL
ncbi:uncharacterized protein LOC142352931 [Convolutriloba macropyga]|uniref:uncharacterized protein LOC142352931 n=1 Tax=Convolutriloba macropyga TaxID=536237 RepID=UPI003F524AFE